MHETKPRARRWRLAAAFLGAALVTTLAPASAEPVGVPVPGFRAGAFAGWGSQNPSTPPESLAGKTITAVAAGTGHSLVLTSDGAVTAWGANSFGESVVPPSLRGRVVTAISTSQYHCLALVSDGTVTAWGRNVSEQTDVPDSLIGKRVTAVAAGRGHSLALTSDGVVIGWGANEDQQAVAPDSLAGRTVTAIAAGANHSLALTSDGTVTAWGRDSEGQTTVPASLTGKTVTAIAAGPYHSLALTSDGVVVAWGEDDQGKIDVPPSLTGETVTAVAAGHDHSLALLADGSVIAWGGNEDGQTDVPAALDNSVVTAIAAGGVHSLAITAPFRAEGAPVVTGTASVGSTLTAEAGRYTARPASLSYQWYADGTPIAGATTVAYTPTVGQAGKRLTVQVTATLPGHAPVVTTSAPTHPLVVAPPTIQLTTPKPTVRRGQPVTLTWSSTFATTVTASGAWTGAREPAGTLTLRPTTLGTTTYALTATNPAGTAASQVQVTVTRPATRLRVTARVGKKLKVTVRGLEKGERYTIRLGKKTVATGTAKTTKPVVRTIKPPRKPGQIALRVTGDQPDRTGTTKVRIRRR